MKMLLVAILFCSMFGSVPMSAQPNQVYCGVQPDSLWYDYKDNSANGTITGWNPGLQISRISFCLTVSDDSGKTMPYLAELKHIIYGAGKKESGYETDNITADSSHAIANGHVYYLTCMIKNPELVGDNTDFRFKLKFKQDNSNGFHVILRANKFQLKDSLGNDVMVDDGSWTQMDSKEIPSSVDEFGSAELVSGRVFALAAPSQLAFALYDLRGVLIAQEQGDYIAEYRPDLDRLAVLPGIYVYRLIESSQNGNLRIRRGKINIR